jgi:hypothetical protein
MNEQVNPKCSKCKCYFTPTEIKSSGLPFKTCEKCRTRDKNSKLNNKCEHNKQKSTCRDCGGSSFCIHNKEKSKCKECGGASICEHNKEKSKCKECGGTSICKHNRIKSQCKECGGGSICDHNRIKSTCKACNGSQICNHNKIKSTCKDCKGGSICIHNKQKSKCKECNFKLYLINLQRVNIKRCFKISNMNKSKHSIEYLGCDIETLINFFEKKIEYFNSFIATDVLMTWDNIHIDHIKPVTKFNLDDENEFLDCCNYTNLQPLLVTDNLEKSNKWSDEKELYWKENIINKEYHEIYI